MNAHGVVTLKSDGQADVTLPIATGYAPIPKTHQSQSVSGGGVIYTATLAPEGKEITLPFRELTRTEYLSLYQFMVAVGWGAAGITIQDPYESHARMHYQRGIETLRWRRGDFYDLTLVFLQGRASTVSTVIV